MEKVILLEMSLVGSTPRPRITGALDGIREILGPIAENDIIHYERQPKRNVPKIAI